MEYHKYGEHLRIARGDADYHTLEFYVSIAEPSCNGGERHIFFHPVYNRIASEGWYISHIGFSEPILHCTTEQIVFVREAYQTHQSLIRLYFDIAVDNDRELPFTKWAVEQVLTLPLSDSERRSVTQRLSQYTNIYVIRDDDSGFYKIGRSNDPESRLRQLIRQDTLLPKENKFTLLWVWPDLPVKEKMLHRLYESRCVRGEWFALTEEDLQKIWDHYVAKEGHCMS